MKYLLQLYNTYPLFIGISLLSLSISLNLGLDTLFFIFILILFFIFFIFHKKQRAFIVFDMIFFIGLGIYSLHQKRELVEIMPLPLHTIENLKGTITQHTQSMHGGWYTIFIQVHSIQSKETQAEASFLLKLLTNQALDIPLKATISLSNPNLELESLGLYKSFSSKFTMDTSDAIMSSSIKNYSIIGMIPKNDPLLKLAKAFIPNFINTFLQDFNKNFIPSIRNFFINSLKDLEQPTQALAFALFLGDKSFLTSYEKELFDTRGLAHILALSGMHLGLLSLALLSVLQLIFHKKEALLISLALIIIYMIIVGFKASLFRAFLLFAIGLIFKLRHQKTSILEILALVFIITINYDFLLFYDLGFRLSFCSVASIIILYPFFLRSLFFVPKFFKESFAVSLAAQVGVLYWSLSVFKAFYPLSLFFNLILSPLIFAFLLIMLLYFLIPSVFGIILVLIHRAIFYFLEYASLTFIGQEKEVFIFFSILFLCFLINLFYIHYKNKKLKKILYQYKDFL